MGSSTRLADPASLWSRVYRAGTPDLARAFAMGGPLLRTRTPPECVVGGGAGGGEGGARGGWGAVASRRATAMPSSQVAFVAPLAGGPLEGHRSLRDRSCNFRCRRWHAEAPAAGEMPRRRWRSGEPPDGPIIRQESQGFARVISADPGLSLFCRARNRGASGGLGWDSGQSLAAVTSREDGSNYRMGRSTSDSTQASTRVFRLASPLASDNARARARHRRPGAGRMQAGSCQTTCGVQRVQRPQPRRQGPDAAPVHGAPHRLRKATGPQRRPSDRPTRGSTGRVAAAQASPLRPTRTACEGAAGEGSGALSLSDRPVASPRSWLLRPRFRALRARVSEVPVLSRARAGVT